MLPTLYHSPVYEKNFGQPRVKKNDHDNTNKYNDNENDHSNCYNNSTLKINSW